VSKKLFEAGTIQGKHLLYLLALCFLLPFTAKAGPGDELVIVSSLVNMRAGPSMDEQVILRLAQDRRLVEIRRSGNWVEVYTDSTKTASGWVYSSLVGSVEQDISTTEKDAGLAQSRVVNTVFELFLLAFAELNERIRRENGTDYFLNASELGNGSIQVTASEVWLQKSMQEKQEDLVEIFEIWAAAVEEGMSISVDIIDGDGDKSMSMLR